MVGDLMSYYSLPQRLAVKREEEKNKKKKRGPSPSTLQSTAMSKGG